MIVLANREDLDVSARAFRLADEALGDRMDPAAPHADDTFDGASRISDGRSIRGP